MKRREKNCETTVVIRSESQRPEARGEESRRIRSNARMFLSRKEQTKAMEQVMLENHREEVQFRCTSTRMRWLSYTRSCKNRNSYRDMKIISE